MANSASNNQNNLPKQVLIIDDDSTVGQSIEGPLASYHVTVVNSQDLETAFFLFNNQDFDVVMVELEFGHLHGLALIQKFRNHDNPEKRATAFILMSGKVRSTADDQLLKELLDVQLIVKPFNLIQTLPYLSRALAAKQRLLKFENFRDKIVSLTKQGQDVQALDAVLKNLTNLGHKGIQLACEVFELAKKYEEGLAFISPLADKDRHVILFQYLKGRFLKLLGRFDEAKVFLEEAYKSSPHHIKRLEDLGQVYLNVAQPEQAVGVMKELLSLTPENQEIKFNMFRDLSEKGFDEAAQKFCRETTQPMEIVRYYNNRGVELSKNGDIIGAITEYERALKYFPDFRENYRIYYNIALSQIKLKSAESYAQAASNLAKCLELNPTFDKAKKTLESLDKVLVKKVG